MIIRPPEPRIIRRRPGLILPWRHRPDRVCDYGRYPERWRIIECAASILQETNNTTAGPASTANLAFVSNLTANSGVHVIVEFTNSVTVSSVVGSLNGTYTAQGSLLNDSSSHFAQQFTVSQSLGGAETITVTLSSSATNIRIRIREIGGTSGFDTHSEQVQVSVATGTASTPSATPAQAPGLSSAFFYNIGGNATLTPTNGFVADVGNAANQMTCHLRYTNTSAVQAQATQSGSGNQTYFAFQTLWIEAASAQLMGAACL